MIDVGSLAEALIFYGTVHVYGHHATLNDIIKSAGAEVFVELVQEGFIKIQYAPAMQAVITRNAGTALEEHDIGHIEKVVSDIEGALPKLIDDQIGKPGRARRLASRIIQSVQTHRPDEALLQSARLDFRDTTITRTVALEVLRDAVPSYQVPNDFRFDVFGQEGEYRVDTNIDFIELNEHYHRLVPKEHSSLTPAYILSMIATTHENIAVASLHQSDLLASPLLSTLIRHRVAGALAEMEKSADELHRFQEFLFKDAKAIGNAVRTGKVSFADLLGVLRKSEKWKEWLLAQPENDNLLDEYYRAVVHETLLEKLPAKATRWSLFVGAGIAVDATVAGGIGTAIGVAVSALDATIVDRLMRGWRPNQFVEGPLRGLIDKAD